METNLEMKIKYTLLAPLSNLACLIAVKTIDLLYLPIISFNTYNVSRYLTSSNEHNVLQQH